MKEDSDQKERCNKKAEGKFGFFEDCQSDTTSKKAKKGSVKNFVALVKNGSFLVRITDMTILIEKEFIYGSSKRPNPTDYYRKQHYQCG